MHDGVAGEERAVANHRVAADERAVGEDRPVADERVVADVAVCHEHVFRADPRVLLERVGAVNGDVFAKVLPSPTIKRVGSPSYFMSCGASPMTQPV